MTLFLQRAKTIFDIDLSDEEENNEAIGSHDFGYPSDSPSSEHESEDEHGDNSEPPTPIKKPTPLLPANNDTNKSSMCTTSLSYLA